MIAIAERWIGRMPSRTPRPHPCLEPEPPAADPARVRDPPQPARRSTAETTTRTSRSRAAPRPKTGSRRLHDQRISPGRMTWTGFSARTGGRISGARPRSSGSCDAAIHRPAPVGLIGYGRAVPQFGEPCLRVANRVDDFSQPDVSTAIERRYSRCDSGMGRVMRPLVRSSMPCSPAGGRALRTWCRSRGSPRVPAGWYARLPGRSWPARVLEPGHRPARPGLSAGAGRGCRAGTAVKGHRPVETSLGVVGRPAPG
jgi:hypothetical protein